MKKQLNIKEYKKYFTQEYWPIPVALILICGIICRTTIATYDSDIFFMVANGEYIVKHGFPHTNPFVIHENFKIIIQQWIPSVITYFFGKSNAWLLIRITTSIAFILLTYATYKLFSLSNEKKIAFLIAPIIALLMPSLLVGKPMLYSIILLVWQIYLCEKNASWKWLPLIVLIEANIHSSFIAFHFVYLLPYIVPGITKFLVNKVNFEYIKAIPFMIIAALMNPYGIDGALYLYYSYSKELLSYNIAELEPIHFFGFDMIPVFIVVIPIIIQIIRKKQPIDSPKFYMFIGSITLLILFPQYRNYIFVIIGSLPLLSINLPKFNLFSPSIKIAWIFTGIAVIAMIFTIAVEIPKVPLSTPKIAEYLKTKENVILFNTFNTGAFLEMQGIKVYQDARPELYIKSLNKKETLINEYVAMQLSYDDEAIERVIKKYNFTHLMTDKDSYLCQYLDEHDYKYIMSDENSYSNIVLFEKP